MQVPIDHIIYMVAVRNGVVSTVSAVFVAGFVAFAAVLRCAFSRVAARYW